MNTTAATVNVSLLLVQVIFLAAPQFKTKSYLLIICILILAISCHLVGPVSQDPGEAQPFTLLWPLWLSSIEKCITAGTDSVERHYWRIDSPAREAQAMRSFGPQKIKWALASIFNSRLVRWNHQVKNVPIQEIHQKRKFLLAQSISFLRQLVMTDLLLQLSIRLFWTPPDGGKFVDSRDLTIRHPSRQWSFTNAVVFGCGPYFFMNMQYAVASVIAVGLGLSQPADWPPLFGKIKNATTVRAFWGQFWHQSIRRVSTFSPPLIRILLLTPLRPLTTLAYFLIDSIGITRGTTFASYFHIWVAFTLSGLLHGQAMALLPRPRNITLFDATVGVVQFFIWQALAITLEDFAQYLWRQSGQKIERLGKLRYIMGYLWVVCSMWISLPWAADVMMRLKLTEESFLGFTVFGPWVNKMVPLPPVY